jgi:hypothetical protein
MQAAVPNIHECLKDNQFSSESTQVAVEGVGRAVADITLRMLD